MVNLAIIGKLRNRSLAQKIDELECNGVKITYIGHKTTGIKYYGPMNPHLSTNLMEKREYGESITNVTT